jgi:tRNA 2-thiocytidine biosynthesis protein TtcA
MQAMPPKFKSDDGRNVVIRPLLGVSEEHLKTLSLDWQIPIIPCNLCGSQDGLKRKKIKSLIKELEATVPHIRSSMASAIANVRTSHLADDRVWDFKMSKTNS